MKIDKTSNTLPTAPAGDAARSPASRTPARGDAAAASTTSVHLGSTTSQLRSMESSIASAPMVDSKKVAEIKQAISEGRFQVNANLVADRLINTVQELVNASQR